MKIILAESNSSELITYNEMQKGFLKASKRQ